MGKYLNLSMYYVSEFCSFKFLWNKYGYNFLLLYKIFKITGQKYYYLLALSITPSVITQYNSIGSQ